MLERTKRKSTVDCVWRGDYHRWEPADSAGVRSRSLIEIGVPTATALDRRRTQRATIVELIAHRKASARSRSSVVESRDVSVVVSIRDRLQTARVNKCVRDERSSEGFDGTWRDKQAVPAHPSRTWDNSGCGHNSFPSFTGEIVRPVVQAMSDRGTGSSRT